MNARGELASFWNLIDLPKATDERGTLTFIETPESIPFVTRRVYYIHDVPTGASRANHAHKYQEQLIVALAGSFTVKLDNGITSNNEVRLGSPQQGLFFGPMTWHSIVDFSPGAICLVLGSSDFQESDYIRDYGDFLASCSGKPDEGRN